MSARQISPPPQLPGFEFVELIGSGGYADVFLYQQTAPRRQVAIKIVDATALDNRTATDYTEEANVMAMVSAHPHIVQVFQASVSPDGRPFLVMEYYPNQNFYERARTEQMSVAEVLRVGIQIASAVETAHRAGILHRDIKPANILTSEFNHPGLTDFGIAAVAGQADHSGDGLSIPWSPPEALGAAPTLVQSDVYSLAATLYTMLAGRAPFEIKGGDNRPLAMMARIEREPVPSIQRADVPRLLERVLVGALAKDPNARPATAADLARQLQEVESSMQLPVTSLQLRENGPIARSRVAEHLDTDATRVKGVTSVDAQGAGISTALPASPVLRSVPARTTQPRPAHPASATPSSTNGSSAVAFEPSVAAVPLDSTPGPAEHPDAGAAEPVSPERPRQLLPEPDVGDTVQRVDIASPEPDEYQAPTSTPKTWLILGSVAALIVLIVVASQLFGGGSAEPVADFSESNTGEINGPSASFAIEPTPVSPLPLAEVSGEKVGTDRYLFKWKNPGGGVKFSIVGDDESSADEIEVNQYETSSTCIQVQVIAPSGLASPPTEGCVQ